ncbi:TRAF-like protein [Pseudocohnilembus persalinus]|uniref:TRAF-like protein n=1 Tax=Pseudocohnilembus persalinus TaxID=266149 RepID=A0A0V0QWL9_PSEPJ|nr:TRAF-like protein [Pseudocohnilembus persalinus]|eukprot:KRX06622.1 TRAF-like protein [Pseudocohnilembus persalinus]
MNIDKNIRNSPQQINNFVVQGIQSQESDFLSQQREESNVNVSSIHVQQQVQQYKLQQINSLNAVENNNRPRQEYEQQYEEMEEQKQNQQIFSQNNQDNSYVMNRSEVLIEEQKQQQQLQRYVEEKEDEEQEDEYLMDSQIYKKYLKQQEQMDQYKGYDENRLILEQNLNESTIQSLKCSICYDICKDPAQCKNCNQNFCFQCIQSETRCPQCREKWQKSKNKRLKNTFIKNLINDNLQISCLYSQLGCTESFYIRQIGDHEQICDYKPITCFYQKNGCKGVCLQKDLQRHDYKCGFKEIDCQNREIGCIAILYRNQLQNHLNNECEYRTAKCNACQWKGYYKERNFHIDNCGEQIIDCEFKSLGCKWDGKRSQQQEHKLNECNYSTFKCEFCLEQLPYDYYKIHQNQVCFSQGCEEQTKKGFQKAIEIVYMLKNQLGCQEQELNKQEKEIKRLLVQNCNIEEKNEEFLFFLNQRNQSYKSEQNLFKNQLQSRDQEILNLQNENQQKQVEINILHNEIEKTEKQLKDMNNQKKEN